MEGDLEFEKQSPIDEALHTMTLCSLQDGDLQGLATQFGYYLRDKGLATLRKHILVSSHWGKFSYTWLQTFTSESGEKSYVHKDTYERIWYLANLRKIPNQSLLSAPYKDYSVEREVFTNHAETHHPPLGQEHWICSKLICNLLKLSFKFNDTLFS